MHNNRNNRDYSSDYNRTNKIYNRCIPTQTCMLLDNVLGRDTGDVCALTFSRALMLL